jgi:hypothetical protein
VVFLN